MSACATLSADAPRRSANEHACAVQYEHSATRLDTYTPRPTTSPGAPPTPKIGTGRFKKFGNLISSKTEALRASAKRRSGSVLARR